MTTFHRPVRRATVARLNAAGMPLAAPVYSSPPVNLDPPFVLVGAISAETAETKTSPAGWYLVAVESWVQSRSPADLDTLSDAVALAMATPPADAAALISRPFLHAEADTWNPDAAGGPTLGRVQTFRLFAQPPF